VQPPPLQCTYILFRFSECLDQLLEKKKISPFPYPVLRLVSFRFVSACFVSFRFLFYNHPDLLVSHKNSDHDSVNASDLLMSQTGNSQGSSSASDLAGRLLARL
jgi:hypothetical protein